MAWPSESQESRRDPKLAELSAEELDQLDTLTKKLALPSSDGPAKSNRIKHRD